MWLVTGGPSGDLALPGNREREWFLGQAHRGSDDWWARMLGECHFCSWAIRTDLGRVFHRPGRAGARYRSSFTGLISRRLCLRR